MEDNTPSAKLLWSIAVIVVLVYALIPVIWIMSLSFKTPETIGDGALPPERVDVRQLRRGVQHRVLQRRRCATRSASR